MADGDGVNEETSNGGPSSASGAPPPNEALPAALQQQSSSTSAKPQDGKPQDDKPQDGKPQDSKLKGGLPQDAKPQGGLPQDAKPQGGLPQDAKPQDGKRTEPKSETSTQTKDTARPTNPFGWIEKTAVYIICAVVLLVAGLALDRNMKTVDRAYESALADIQSESDATGASAHDRFTTKVAILGMRDMVSLRSAVLFVGFLALMLGSVLVLKGVEATYNLKLTDGAKEATLTTASPGLVLITAGVVLVIVALKVESKVSLELQGGGRARPADETRAGGVQTETEVPDVN